MQLEKAQRDLRSNIKNEFKGILHWLGYGRSGCRLVRI